jgi:hypothetical protein
MARFHVRDTFALNDKSAFVLAGFVLEGEVTAGMFARIPFREDVTVGAEIAHIEILRRPDGEVVCLSLRCENPDEVKLWEALRLKEKILDIIKTPHPQ